MRHLLSIDDLEQDEVDGLIESAKQWKARKSDVALLSGKIVALLFYEPSTRTELSFSSAAQRLGAGVIGFADPSMSSVAKGESLLDTIQVVQTYSDCIVLRHPVEGSAAQASTVAHVPVINGGDGGNEHPTQTLFDLMTIEEHHRRLTGLRVGLFGDPRWARTAHSFSKALAGRGNELVCIGPEQLQLSSELAADIEARGSRIERVEAVESVIGSLDVLYVTRPQRERWHDVYGAEQPTIEPLTVSVLQQARDDLIVLHPLPRNDELPSECDKDPRAAYFRQVANGVPMRMAILDKFLAAR